MCGRYTWKTPKEDIARQFDVEIDDKLEPRYNIAPAHGRRRARGPRRGRQRVCISELGTHPELGRRLSYGE